MDAQIAAVDEWLAGTKSLDGLPPQWGNHYGRDHSFRWGILDALKISRGELSVTCDQRQQKPSICVMFDRKLVYRVDIVPDGECETNHLLARSQGLPPLVCGSHFHPWAANREWVRTEGFGELPVKEPAPKALRTLEQALAALAQATNLTLESNQRDIRLPSQAGLF